jgi:hypothetical protein
MLQLAQNSPLAPQISGLRGTDFAAWTLAPFTISVRAGALIRRMIPGIVAAITAWSGLLAAAVFWLHNHYQAPLTGVPAPRMQIWATRRNQTDRRATVRGRAPDRAGPSSIAPATSWP